MEVSYSTTTRNEILNGYNPFQIEVKVRVPATGAILHTFTHTDIVLGSLIVTYPFSERGYTVGATPSSSCKLSIDNTNGQFRNVEFRGNEVLVSVGVDNGTSVEMIPMGVFLMEATYAENKINLSGYDRMILADIPGAGFVEQVLIHCDTLGEAASTFGTYCGIPVGDVYGASKAIPNYLEGYETMTCRDVFQDLLIFMGVNSRIDRYGKLEIYHRSQNSKAVQVSGANAKQLETTQDPVSYTQVIINYGASAIPVGANIKNSYVVDRNVYIVNGTSASQARANIEASVLGFTDYPFDAELRSNPTLEPGRTIMSVTDYDGVTRSCTLGSCEFDLSSWTPINFTGDYHDPASSGDYDARVIAAAVQEARKLAVDFENVNETLASKSTIYGAVPQPPYKKDDLWIQPPITLSDLRDLGYTLKQIKDWELTIPALFGPATFVCVKTKDTGQFLMSDWKLMGLNDRELAGLVTKEAINVPGAIPINAGNVVNGVMSSKDGSTWIDLEDGSFDFANGGFTFRPNAGAWLAGWAISEDGLSYVERVTYGPFTQADLDRVDQIIAGSVEPNYDDYTYYDVTGDGRISIKDRTMIQMMYTGGMDPTFSNDLYFYINPSDPGRVINVKSVDLENGLVSNFSTVGAGGISTSNLFAANAEMWNVRVDGHLLGNHGDFETMTITEGLTATLSIGGQALIFKSGILVQAPEG